VFKAVWDEKFGGYAVLPVEENGTYTGTQGETLDECVSMLKEYLMLANDLEKEPEIEVLFVVK